MDDSRTKALQERTDAKLRFANVHLDELKSLEPLTGDDFDRAHQESFLFHLFGARDALLAELNHYYGAGIEDNILSLGRIRKALKQQGIQSPELQTLYELEHDNSSWFRQAKDMRDYSMHVQNVPRTYHLGGEDHGKVKLKNPRSGMLTGLHFVEEFDDWLKKMGALVRSLRDSALARPSTNASFQGTPASVRR